jgi:hypothetical protein
MNTVADVAPPKSAFVTPVRVAAAVPPDSEKIEFMAFFPFTVAL